MSETAVLVNGALPFELREQLQKGCHVPIEGYNGPYDYHPSLAAGVVFLTLFALTMLGHIAQMVWKRTWWMAVFWVGSLTEVIGWAARTWSAECPYNSDAFLMQITTLIIAPTFYTAGIYILLGRFIQILGRESSALSPKLYLWIFVVCDVISLVVQAVGGAMASTESDKENGNTDPGTNVMVAGILFQMVSITIFVLCATDFVRRSLRRRLLQPMTGTIIPLLGAMIFSVICIYIRSIYRTIELLQGWDGYLITTERFFCALDGAMMVLAVAVFNIFHPGWLLPGGRENFRRKPEIDEGSANELC
ncbi:RTA1 like protein-domain-containing protein [Aspergillus pseudoustus]|uniref:RTA1 like protein-domain-containing protein n=1 Tax=Aspergillus pseudoustus TaxID=1810923 RepID=A0ABR4J8Z4_9EURO